MLRQLRKEGSFRLIMPVGLLDGAPHVTGGIESTAGRICATRMRRQILLLVNLHRLEVRGPEAHRIFQNH